MKITNLIMQIIQKVNLFGIRYNNYPTAFINQVAHYSQQAGFVHHKQ